MQHVTATILMEMDLRVTRKLLHAQISAVQKSEDSSSLINRIMSLDAVFQIKIIGRTRPTLIRDCLTSPGGYHNH